MKVICNMGAAPEFYVASWSASDSDEFLDCVAKQIAAAAAIWPTEIGGVMITKHGRTIRAAKREQEQ